MKVFKEMTSEFFSFLGILILAWFFISGIVVNISIGYLYIDQIYGRAQCLGSSYSYSGLYYAGGPMIVCQDSNSNFIIEKLK